MSFVGPLALIPTGGWLAAIKAFGDPKPVDAGGGRLSVSDAWKQSNLITVKDLPGYEGKSVTVHKLVEPYLREALRLAKAWAPNYRIESLASFVPRYIRWDSDRDPSIHTVAAAFDINPSANKPGTKGTMPPEFVRAFKSVGFDWGGDWSPKNIDPMHFQLLHTAGWRPLADTTLLALLLLLGGGWWLFRHYKG